MATNHYNVSGTTTTTLISAGDKRQISRISLTNTNSSNAVTVDLFIQKVIKYGDTCWGYPYI